MSGFSKMSIQRSVELFLSSALRHSLPQQELVDRLLFPHALHNQPIQVNEQSAAKTTGDPAHKDTVCQIFYFFIFFLLKAKQERILGENKISNLEKETHCRWNMLLPSGLLFWGSLMESQTLLTNLISSLYVCWHQTNQFRNKTIWTQLALVIVRVQS